MEKIERRKLADEVFDRLLRMLETGELQAGDFVPSERELMQHFGVGRPAVREALQRLEMMGVIEIQHGQRAKLARLGPSTVLDTIDRTVRHLMVRSPELRDHLREARLLFELGMVRLAARKAEPADLERLQAAWERQASAKGDPPAFVAADVAFHNAIAAVSGNPLFTAVSEALLQWLFERYPSLLRVPGLDDLTLQEHAEILRAVASGDEQSAGEAMLRHLTRSDPRYAQAQANLKADRR
ncbi:MAG TPA: transcriptional regulator NanR [Acidobacteriota bacterium]|nr:transcriptional regulator NanR [Acidobacteriota bacterium]